MWILQGWDQLQTVCTFLNEIQDIHCDSDLIKPGQIKLLCWVSTWPKPDSTPG